MLNYQKVLKNIPVINETPALHGTTLETAKIVSQKHPAMVFERGSCFRVGIERVNNSKKVVSKQKA